MATYASLIAVEERVSALISRIANGEPHAARELWPLVYAELRRLAARELAHRDSGRTLQATELVHEAYLRLVGSDGDEDRQWTSRGHFFAAAARAMRCLLVDRARARGAQKRSGGLQRLELELVDVSVADPPPELLDLDAALERLALEAPLAAQLVDLRFFAGLTQAEAAASLGLPATTADRHWTYARAWLFDALRGEAPG